MSLRERLTELIQACFTGLWIETHEPDEALPELAQLCQAENWRYATWNIDTGLQIGGAETIAAGQDPLAAIRALHSMADSNGTTLLVLQNFHRFLGSAEIVQALIEKIHQGKQHRTFIVVLAPVVNIPIELEKLFVIIEHELPNREQLGEIARQIATEPTEIPSGRDWETLLDAAAGLTRYEAEGAFSLSLVRHERLQPQAIWSIKEGLLKKSGLLQLYRGQETFDSLGGLHSLKAFCRRALLQSSRLPSRPRPRGLLLVSPSGCGKSQFCKALGSETGRPVLQLDIGTLMGSLVGQSEERMRQVLKIADAMSPCILMIDEVEKALSGDRTAEAFCFSPREAQATRLAELARKRKTPLNQGNRPGTNRKRNPKRRPGERYTSVSYARAIARACAKAFPVPKELGQTEAAKWITDHCWQPNRIRHSAATEIRKKFGLEAASVVLGHAKADVTQIYAERDLSKAMQVAAEIG